MSGAYDIIPATEKDRERIAQFFRDHYYTQEPINLAAGAPPDRPTDSMYAMDCLAEGKSLLAVSRDGRRILGVCINGEIRPNEDNHSRTQLRNISENYAKVAKFLTKIEHSVDIFKLTGCDRALAVHILSVHPAESGKGIGKTLMERSRDSAISAGYPLLYVLCTNYYSAKIARNMGMESVYTVPYSDYKDENGTPVLAVSKPHTDITIFLQKL